MMTDTGIVPTHVLANALYMLSVTNLLSANKALYVITKLKEPFHVSFVPFQ